MSNVLSVRGFRKSYGRHEAVKGIDFDVAENEIFALIGPNGAGKTTTLRVVATILQPSAGSLMLGDTDIGREPAAARERIAYLPEEAGAYKNLSGIEYLDFMASMYFSDADAKLGALETARDVSGLGQRLNDKLGTYSKGMTRKLLLARSIMTKPRLAILDEPTSGLDVLNALEVRNTIKGFARAGMSVLLSSHNMLEVEHLSDRVAIIHEGLIRATGTPAELKERYASANLEEVFAEVAR